jgi:hypothetical protein
MPRLVLNVPKEHNIDNIHDYRERAEPQHYYAKGKGEGCFAPSHYCLFDYIFGLLHITCANLPLEWAY